MGLKYRADIDGLRAISVILVVIFHAFPTLIPGGFIGVDIFFVISGYLISTIIFERLENGNFNFIDFYSRRIRRIFPALALVLFTCFAVGWFVLLADEYKQLGKHIAAAAGFVSNFILLNEVDYFDVSAELKPLLHLWSLGIEEQFYIIYPFVLWIAWRRNLNLLTITIGIAIASFILSLKGVAYDRGATFYLPWTRFWELLAGSVLAWFTLYKQLEINNFKNKMDRFLASIVYRNKETIGTKTLVNTISVLGVLILTYGSLRINKQVSFPDTWALVPVCAAVLILGAGPRAWINQKILSNRVLVWSGMISFPLYLWHWPLLSFARILEGESLDIYVRLCAIALSIVLAWLTYKFIERPIRFGRHGKLSVAILVGLMVAVGYMGYNIFSRDGLSFRLKNFYEKNTSILSQIGIPPNHQLRTKACVDVFTSFDEGLCVLKHKKLPDILLVGDSYALQYYSGLARFIPEKNIGMLGAGWARVYGEPLNPLIGSYSDKTTPNYARQQEIYRLIQTNPSIVNVVLACSPHYCFGSDFEKNLRATFDYLAPLNRHVYFVIGIPQLPFDPKLCLDEGRPFRMSQKNKSPCAYSYSDYLSKNLAYRTAIFKVLSDYPRVKIFDPSSIMCDANYCHAMKEGKLLYRNEGDNAHLSDDGSSFIAPFLARLIDER